MALALRGKDPATAYLLGRLVGRHAVLHAHLIAGEEIEAELPDGGVNHGPLGWDLGQVDIDVFRGAVHVQPGEPGPDDQ